ncbi:MAG: HAMP domain-containing sensor histidine kinase, partial [Methanoculleus horonobensis]|nr:HAMP domain-containing sensor histidine kinase [Methanoculleus horonobensis]
ESIGNEIGSGVLRSMLHKRLEAAHRETNLYLDIMTHDIKNAENVANLYCDLLLDMLDGDAAAYAKKLKESVRKSTGILQNVSTIRRTHQEPPELAPVHLGQIIRAGIDRTSDADISFTGSSAEVWADDLLSEVFTNLVGNAVQFGGPGVGITIRVEDDPEEVDTVMVSVEDTGPGIPDEMKETVFDRFNRGYGEGLGLYIVGTLVTRYGGRVWVEDRVEGHPDEGASFRFTLREVVRTGTDDEME